MKSGETGLTARTTNLNVRLLTVDVFRSNGGRILSSMLEDSLCEDHQPDWLLPENTVFPLATNDDPTVD